MNDYYETLAGVLKDSFKANGKPYTVAQSLYYNSLFILKENMFSYRVFPHPYSYYRSYISKKYSWSPYYPLSKSRATLASALRTADRLQERGYDEWGRDIKTILAKIQNR